MMLDINSRTWSNELLDYVGLRESMLGEVAPANTVIGTIDHFGDYRLP